MDDNRGPRFSIREGSALQFVDNRTSTLYCHEVENKLFMMSFELDSKTVPVKRYGLSKYRIARNFQGVKFSLFSRIFDEPRKFYPRKFK